MLPTLTVAENVALPLMLDGARQSQTNKRTIETLGRVGLADRTAHFPAELSGSEMQRAALARAVVTQPDALGSPHDMDYCTDDRIAFIMDASPLQPESDGQMKAPNSPQ